MNQEKRLRRLEIQNRLLFLLVILLLFLGATQPPDTVRATRFELVNEQGRILGVWGPQGQDVSLAMVSRREGTSKVILRADPKPSLMMFSQGQTYAEFELEPEQMRWELGATQPGKRPGFFEPGEPWASVTLDKKGKLVSQPH